MSALFPIKVECYSGYKGDEYPRCFYIGNNRFDVEEITDRWYQTSAANEQESSASTFPDAYYYKVKTNDHKIYILRHETKDNKWYVLIKGESKGIN